MKYLLLTLNILFVMGCTSSTLNAITEEVELNKSSTEAILKLETGGHTAKINDILVTKSGDIISASDDKTIRVWDSKTGKEKRRILGEIGDDMGEIYNIALSPNEKFLVVGGYKFNDRIYDYKTGKLLKTGSYKKFSSDGKFLFSEKKIWDVENNFAFYYSIPIKTNENIKGMIFIDNSYKLILLNYGKKTISLFSLKDKKIIKTINFDKYEELPSISMSNKHFSMEILDKKIYVYDFNFNLITTIPLRKESGCAKYSPNGKYLITGFSFIEKKEKYTTSIDIYDAENEYKKIASLKKSTNYAVPVAILNNQTAIYAEKDASLHIWKINTLKAKNIEGVGEVIANVKVKGNNIIWKNENKIVQQFNLETMTINRKEFQNFKNPSLRKGDSSLHINKKITGKVSGSKYRFLELKKDNKIVILESFSILPTCYGFFENYIIVGDGLGGLRVYNSKGVKVARLLGHLGRINSMSIEKDKLITGSHDQTIRIWDLSQLKRYKNEDVQTVILNDFNKKKYENKIVQQLNPQLNLFITNNDDWIAWTPEGFYDASKGAEKYIGYHINQGANKEAEFLDITRFKKQFYRPGLIKKAIAGEEISHYAKGIDIDTLLTAGLPPKVEILTPSQEIDENSVEIDVKVCEKDGGVENLRFYVDDVSIKYLSKTKAYSSKVKKVKECVIKTEVISVPHGKHTIGFDTTNKAGNIISNRSTINIENNTPVESKPNLHLLTLSIADYQDDTLDLNFPNNDATELTATFKKIGEPIFENVYDYALKDENVTQEVVEQTVRKIAKQVGANDVFVLYLSGHGKTNDIDGDYYFIPYTCRSGADIRKDAISQHQLKKIIEQVPTSQSVILLDTCDSGSMATERSIDDSSVKRFGNNVGRSIIAGATAKQDAIDGYKQHGIFTYVVLDAMNNEKLYDYRDKLTISHIAIYLKDILPKLSKEQFGHEQKPVIYQHGDTTFDIGGLE